MLAVANTTNETLLYLALVNEVGSFIMSDVKHSWDCLACISGDYRCCGNSAAVSKAHLQRHWTALFTSTGLQDHAQIKAFAAPSHSGNQTALRNHERGEQLCWKRCSFLSSVHLILYSSLCIAVYRLVTKTFRHPIASAAARGAKPSWSPAKNKCDQIRECKQMPTQLQAHISQYRCQFMSKKHTNCINSTLQVCFGLMETRSQWSCL